MTYSIQTCYSVITQKGFNQETTYFMYGWSIKKKGTYRIGGSKVISLPMANKYPFNMTNFIFLLRVCEYITCFVFRINRVCKNGKYEVEWYPHGKYMK